MAALKKLIGLLLTAVLAAPPWMLAQAAESVAAPDAAAFAAPDAPAQEAANPIPARPSEAVAAVIARLQLDIKDADQELAAAKALNNQKLKKILFQAPPGMTADEARANQYIRDGKEYQAERAADLQQLQKLSLAASKVSAGVLKLYQAAAPDQPLKVAPDNLLKLTGALGTPGPGQGALPGFPGVKVDPVSAKEIAAAGKALSANAAEARALSSQAWLLGTRADHDIKLGNSILARLNKAPVVVGRGVDGQAAAQEKEERVRNLVGLLNGISDADYAAAAKRAGIDAPAPRQEVIKTGYTTMAALEYRQAQQAAGDKGEGYSQNYQKIVKQDSASVAIDPDTLQESGRGWDIIKQAAWIALKVGVAAAITAAGQEIKPPEQAQLDARIAGDSAALAQADAAKSASLHGDLGAAYEQTAAGIKLSVTADPDQPHLLSDGKRARLGQLANLLQSISDEDYDGAVGQLVAQIPTKGQRPPLATRAGALRVTYSAMAQDQYGRAAQLAPSEPKYAQADDRVSGQESAVGAQPQTLQQTGWAVDLLSFLGNAAINYELNGGQVYVGRSLQDQTIAKLDKELAAASLTPEKEAELRYRLGQAYEAEAQIDEARPAPPPLPKEKETTAPQAAAPSAPAVRQAEAQAAPQAQPAAPAKSEEERLHEDMQKMESTEKEMSEELRRREDRTRR
jgi:hypothetical protein